MEITIKELKELRERLENEISDNIYDDGSDDNDAEQNAAYTREVKIIDEVGERLAQIDCIEAFQISGLELLWESCWENGESHLPEEKCNHHMRYIDRLIELYVNTPISEKHS